jgi:hypothetical protein
MHPSGDLSCLDIEAWRAFNKQEMRDYLAEMSSGAAKRKGISRYKSLLVVREHLSPVDVYCYLKARFGEPKGFQTFLRDDSSDNWIHWDLICDRFSNGHPLRPKARQQNRPCE